MEVDQKQASEETHGEELAQDNVPSKPFAVLWGDEDPTLEKNSEQLFEFEKDSLAIPFHLQGDLSFNQEALLNARREMKSDPAIRKTIGQFWDLLSPQDYAVTREQYVDLIMKFYKVLRSPITELEARKNAQRDWYTDVKGSPDMDFEKFVDAIYEVVDLWTCSISLEVYVAFLNKLFERITSRVIVYKDGSVVKADSKEDATRGVPLKLVKNLKGLLAMFENDPNFKTVGDILAAGADYLELQRQKYLDEMMKEQANLAAEMQLGDNFIHDESESEQILQKEESMSLLANLDGEDLHSAVTEWAEQNDMTEYQEDSYHEPITFDSVQQLQDGEELIDEDNLSVATDSTEKVYIKRIIKTTKTQRNRKKMVGALPVFPRNTPGGLVEAWDKYENKHTHFVDAPVAADNDGGKMKHKRTSSSIDKHRPRKLSVYNIKVAMVSVDAMATELDPVLMGADTEAVNVNKSAFRPQVATVNPRLTGHALPTNNSNGNNHSNNRRLKQRKKNYSKFFERLNLERHRLMQTNHEGANNVTIRHADENGDIDSSVMLEEYSNALKGTHGVEVLEIFDEDLARKSTDDSNFNDRNEHGHGQDLSPDNHTTNEQQRTGGEFDLPLKMLPLSNAGKQSLCVADLMRTRPDITRSHTSMLRRGVSPELVSRMNDGSTFPSIPTSSKTPSSALPKMRRNSRVSELLDFNNKHNENDENDGSKAIDIPSQTPAPPPFASHGPFRVPFQTNRMEMSKDERFHIDTIRPWSEHEDTPSLRGLPEVHGSPPHSPSNSNSRSTNPNATVSSHSPTPPHSHPRPSPILTSHAVTSSLPPPSSSSSNNNNNTQRRNSQPQQPQTAATVNEPSSPLSPDIDTRATPMSLRSSSPSPPNERIQQHHHKPTVRDLTNRVNHHHISTLTEETTISENEDNDAIRKSANEIMDEYNGHNNTNTNNTSNNASMKVGVEEPIANNNNNNNNQTQNNNNDNNNDDDDDDKEEATTNITVEPNSADASLVLPPTISARDIKVRQGDAILNGSSLEFGSQYGSLSGGNSLISQPSANLRSASVSGKVVSPRKSPRPPTTGRNHFVDKHGHVHKRQSFVPAFKRHGGSLRDSSTLGQQNSIRGPVVPASGFSISSVTPRKPPIYIKHKASAPPIPIPTVQSSNIPDGSSEGSDSDEEDEELPIMNNNNHEDTILDVDADGNIVKRRKELLEGIRSGVVDGLAASVISSDDDEEEDEEAHEQMLKLAPKGINNSSNIPSSSSTTRNTNDELPRTENRTLMSSKKRQSNKLNRNKKHQSEIDQQIENHVTNDDGDGEGLNEAEIKRSLQNIGERETRMTGEWADELMSGCAPTPRIKPYHNHNHSFDERKNVMTPEEFSDKAKVRSYKHVSPTTSGELKVRVQADDEFEPDSRDVSVCISKVEDNLDGDDGSVREISKLRTVSAYSYKLREQQELYDAEEDEEYMGLDENGQLTVSQFNRHALAIADHLDEGVIQKRQDIILKNLEPRKRPLRASHFESTSPDPLIEAEDVRMKLQRQHEQRKRGASLSSAAKQAIANQQKQAFDNMNSPAAIASPHSLHSFSHNQTLRFLSPRQQMVLKQQQNASSVSNEEESETPVSLVPLYFQNLYQGLTLSPTTPQTAPPLIPIEPHAVPLNTDPSTMNPSEPISAPTTRPHNGRISSSAKGGKKRKGKKKQIPHIYIASGTSVEKSQLPSFMESTKVDFNSSVDGETIGPRPSRFDQDWTINRLNDFSMRSNPNMNLGENNNSNSNGDDSETDFQDGGNKYPDGFRPPSPIQAVHTDGALFKGLALSKNIPKLNIDTSHMAAKVSKVEIPSNMKTSPARNDKQENDTHVPVTPINESTDDIPSFTCSRIPHPAPPPSRILPKTARGRLSTAEMPSSFQSRTKPSIVSLQMQPKSARGLAVRNNQELTENEKIIGFPQRKRAIAPTFGSTGAGISETLEHPEYLRPKPSKVMPILGAAYSLNGRGSALKDILAKAVPPPTTADGGESNNNNHNHVPPQLPPFFKQRPTTISKTDKMKNNNNFNNRTRHSKARTTTTTSLGSIIFVSMRINNAALSPPDAKLMKDQISDTPSFTLSLCDESLFSTPPSSNFFAQHQTMYGIPGSGTGTSPKSYTRKRYQESMSKQKSARKISQNHYRNNIDIISSLNGLAISGAKVNPDSNTSLTMQDTDLDVFIEDNMLHQDHSTAMTVGNILTSPAETINNIDQNFAADHSGRLTRASLSASPSPQPSTMYQPIPVVQGFGHRRRAGRKTRTKSRSSSSSKHISQTPKSRLSLNIQGLGQIKPIRPMSPNNTTITHHSNNSNIIKATDGSMMPPLVTAVKSELINNNNNNNSNGPPEKRKSNSRFNDFRQKRLFPHKYNQEPGTKEVSKQSPPGENIVPIYKVPFQQWPDLDIADVAEQLVTDTGVDVYCLSPELSVSVACTLNGLIDLLVFPLHPPASLALKQLEKLLEYAPCGVVALSFVNALEIMDRCLNMGVLDVVSNPRKLDDAVTRILKARERSNLRCKRKHTS
eukprot:TRINITY_DN7657_c0_g2_i2.p1 TRINITY_DN7657_c0_g2~~TRINITY_DN7657_c0_g2_i2.p1  ORF type:complete len:2522 (-),score=805.10 TRINITY_DN7657_c0_g2_i2:267-7832(-)